MTNCNLKSLRVSINQMYNDRITFPSGVTLYMDTFYNHEEKVAVSGVVTYAPKTGPIAKAGISEGDTIYFDYRVVSDGDMLPDYSRTHSNLITIDGNSEWFVADWHVMAIVKDGEIVPYNKYVFAKPTVTKSAFLSKVLYAPESSKNEVNYNLVTVIAASQKAVGLTKGDRVFIRGDLAQKYSLTGDPNDITIIINYDYIVAKEL